VLWESVEVTLVAVKTGKSLTATLACKGATIPMDIIGMLVQVLHLLDTSRLRASSQRHDVDDKLMTQ